MSDHRCALQRFPNEISVTFTLQCSCHPAACNPVFVQHLIVGLYTRYGPSKPIFGVRLVVPQPFCLCLSQFLEHASCQPVVLAYLLALLFPRKVSADCKHASIYTSLHTVLAGPYKPLLTHNHLLHAGGSKLSQRLPSQEAAALPARYTDVLLRLTRYVSYT